jgi:hypothetical protein
MLKLHAFNLTDYHRVIFMDADQFVLQNMDALFESVSPADLAAPQAYWLLPGEFPEGYHSAGWSAGNGPEVGPQMKFGSWIGKKPGDMVIISSDFLNSDQDSRPPNIKASLAGLKTRMYCTSAHPGRCGAGRQRRSTHRIQQGMTHSRWCGRSGG